jgi:hypothetical protein
MRKLHTALLAAGGLALAAGTAYAAGKLNTMNVTLPDGSVAQIHYEGNVAPRVAVVPVDARVVAGDPFAEIDRLAAMMRARHAAMLRQAAELQQRAQQQVLAAQHGGAGQPGQVVVSSNLPTGSYSYTFVSSTTSANGCTQTVQWRSDGSSAEPRVTKTSAGDCSAAGKDAPAIPAAAPARPSAPTIPAAVLERQARQPAGTT